MKKIEIKDVEIVEQRAARWDKATAIARGLVGTEGNFVQVEWGVADDRTYAVLCSTPRTVDEKEAWKIDGRVVRFTGIYIRGDEWRQFVWPPDLLGASDVVLGEHLFMGEGKYLSEEQIIMADRELREMAVVAQNSLVIKSLDMKRWIKWWLATKDSLDKNRAVLKAFIGGDGSLGNITGGLQQLIDGDLRRIALMEEYIKEGLLDKDILAEALKNPSKEIRVLIIKLCKDLGRKTVRVI